MIARCKTLCGKLPTCMISESPGRCNVSWRSPINGNMSPLFIIMEDGEIAWAEGPPGMASTTTELRVVEDAIEEALFS